MRVNDGFDYAERIEPAAAGRSVLSHLVARYPHTNEAGWGARIDSGEVSLDGSIARRGDLLRAGARLVWRRPPWIEPEVPLAFAVLHLDEHLLAVAKPRGLPSMPNGGFLQHTLLHVVRQWFPQATPVHRLGRGTSGLVLCARTETARRVVSAAWRAGEVEKDYVALVSGVTRPAFSVEVAIGPVPHPRLGSVYAASPTGKPALTHVRRLAVRADGHSIVGVGIPTGRPHQIRIHLAAAGHPLLGDPLYVAGGVPGAAPGLPGDLGYRLHAHRLALAHPVTGQRLVLECGLPPELRADALGQNR